MFREGIHAHQTVEAMRGKEQKVDLSQRLSVLKSTLEEVETSHTGDDYQRETEALQTQLKEIEDGGNSFSFMRDVLERLQRETNAMHDWVENGLYFDLINAEIGTPRTFEGLHVRWGNKIEGDRYANFLRSIFMSGEDPSYVDIIEALVKKGRLPGRIRGLGHEVVHSFQFPKASDFWGNFKYHHRMIERSKELRESHANRLADRPPDKKTQDQLHGHILNARYSNGEKFYKGIDSDKLSISIQVIDKLNALGFTSEEIGKIVLDNSKWDKKNNTYPGIERIIEEEKKKLGMSDEELDTLVQIDRVERQIERYRVMDIVREEINKWESDQTS